MSFNEEVNPDNFPEDLQNEYLNKLIVVFDEYLESLRLSKGNLSQFWMTYIDMVNDILFGLIRAYHEGN